MDNQIKTVAVMDDNEAVLTCPKCTQSKTVDVSRFMDAKPPIKLKVKCQCKHSYKVILEKRDRIRKQTNLTGAYENLTPGKEGQRGSMSVMDISRTGLKTKISEMKIKIKEHDVYTATADKASFDYKTQKTTGELNIDDTLLMEFRLDDTKRSLIKKEVVVKWINWPYAGVQFSSTPLYDGSLGFYMMSN